MDNNIPLQFKVWDTHEQKYVPPESFTIDGTGYLSVNVGIRMEDGSYTYVEVDNEDGRFKVQQDTGIKDHNGNSIYTEDILRWGGEVGFVEYGAGECGLRFGKHEWPATTWVNLYDISAEAEVVGSLHSTPELLTWSNTKWQS